MYVYIMQAKRLIVTVWTKHSHVLIQTEIHIITPAYSTLIIYVYPLPPLANVNWFAFPEWLLPTI